MIVFDAFETVPWSAFAPEVIVVATDVPPAMAEHYIRESAIALAAKSQVLVRTFRLDIQAGVQEYVLRPHAQERIESMQAACINSRFGENRIRLGHHGAHGGTCLPCWGEGTARFEWPDRVHLDRMPHTDREGATWLRAAVVPTRDACEVDRVLYERYHETVIAGALARLLRAKGTPYTDLTEAVRYAKEAENGATKAGLDRMTGGMRGPFPMKTRRVV